MWSEDDGELSSVILEVDYGYAVLTGVTRAHDIGRWTESEIQRRDWIHCRNGHCAGIGYGCKQEGEYRCLAGI